MPRKKGPPSILGNRPLTKAEIARRFREAMKEEGKAQVSVWIDGKLAGELRAYAKSKKLTINEALEKILFVWMEKEKKGLQE